MTAKKEYNYTTWKDLLTSYDGREIVYDAQGNPTSYLGHTLTWEKGRQLKSFDSNTYTYNANGIRTSKTVDGVTHTYTLDGTKILRETWGNNTLIPLYDNEESVCGILYNDEPFYFFKNLQGDIISIMNREGNVVAKYSYDAWGACTVTQNTSSCQIATINPFRYRGYYYDRETALYYMSSRYYDFVNSRFICCDIIESILPIQNVLEVNLYSYCECDAVNTYDSNGAISWNKIFEILNKIADCAKKVLEYLIDGASWILGIKTNLRWNVFSRIASEIKRSPHRVKQWFNWLEDSVKNLKSALGKILKAFAYIVFFSSIVCVLGKVTDFIAVIAKTILNKIAEGLAALISKGISKGIKAISKFVPALGGVAGFLLGEIIGRVLDKFFERYSTQIANRYANKVDIYSFNAGDYFTTFFKCLI